MKTPNALKKTIHALSITLALGCLLSAPSFAAGPGSDGGGDSIAAHYAAVMRRTIKALKMVCATVDSKEDLKLCELTPKLERISQVLKIEPRKHNTITGNDGQARDAGNDGTNKIYLDVDRWVKNEEIQKESNSSADLRRRQILLALHEPLVLLRAEKNDNYRSSNAYIDLLKRNFVDLGALAGTKQVSEVNREEKIFRGISNEDGSNPNQVCNFAEALFDAISKASDQGYDNCKEETSMRSENRHGKLTMPTSLYINRECVAFAKCSRKRRSFEHAGDSSDPAESEATASSAE